LTRSEFLRLLAGGIVAEAWNRSSLASVSGGVSAVAFDGFPIFDPRGVSRVAEELFPGRGSELVAAWRARQFEYQWLRALGGKYADFQECTSAGLAFAARQLHIDLTTQTRDRLVDVYLALPVWPDVRPALAALKGAGLRLAILSNMTPGMLGAGIRMAGLVDAFEHVLSTDRLKTYKPDPRAYGMAVDAFGLARERILFVAFAGWDVAGAKWFGYPTFWVNRLNQPEETLGVEADGSGPGLDDLVAWIRRRS
jgi:2-haloacid dehalogenase